MNSRNLLSRFPLFTAFLFFLLIGMSNVLQGQNCDSTWVDTDQDDYYPGEYVIISGGHWQPGETVYILIHHLVYTLHQDTEIWTTAFGNGEIYDNSFLIIEQEIGEEFLLVANGLSSGCVDTATFTDSQPLPFHNVQFTSSGVTTGTVVTVIWSGTYRDGTVLTNQTFSLTAPGPSGNLQLVDGTTLTYSYQNVSGYTLISESPSSPFTVPSTGPTVVITGTYQGCTGPTITCPADLTDVPTDLGQCYATGVALGTPTFTANCGLASLTNNAPAQFPKGMTIVTWTVTDLLGNTATCAQNVTVKDHENPTISCPGSIIRSNDLGNCSAVVTYTAPVGTDNCPGATTAQIAGLASGSAFPVGVTTNSFEVTDAAGNKASCSFTVTVNDTELPQITCPGPIVKSNDAGYCSAVVNYTAPVGTDNCPGATTAQIAGLASGSAFPVGVTTNSFEVTDAAGNKASCSFTVTVNDTELPSITCPTTVTDVTDAGECYATMVIGDLGTPTTDDNCGVQSTSNNFAALFPLGQVPFGQHNITWTVTDINGNSSSCTQIINVNSVTTITIVAVSPTSQQYSDQVTFTASITPYFCGSAGTAATSVTFKVNTQVMGTADLVNGTATLTANLLETVNNTMTPGSKTVTAVFNGKDPDFTIADPTTSLTLTKEDASATYVGVEFQATPNANNSSATVQLMATVVDANDPAQGARGDIREAKVRFLVYTTFPGTAIWTSSWLVPGLVNQNDLTVGQVSNNYTFTIPSGDYWTFIIQIEIGETSGYYTGMGLGTVTIYKPLTSDFITGGGHIIPNQSAGQYSSTPGLNTNFGFHVKYNKKGINLQGGMNVIFRRMEGGVEHNYQIKSTSMVSLGVNVTIPTAMTAVFTTKANLKDVTNPTNPISLGGNLDLKVTMTDRGEPGNTDGIGITLWNGSTLLFSSNWNGSNTTELNLSGGNLVVHSGFSFNPNAGEAEPPIIAEETNTPGLLVFPNPFNDYATFQFVPEKDTKAKLQLFDINGRLVETLYEGNVFAGEKYEFLNTRKSPSSAMLIYRLTLEDKVITGKLLRGNF